MSWHSQCWISKALGHPGLARTRWLINSLLGAPSCNTGSGEDGRYTTGQVATRPPKPGMWQPSDCVLRILFGPECVSGTTVRSVQWNRDSRSLGAYVTVPRKHSGTSAEASGDMCPKAEGGAQALTWKTFGGSQSVGCNPSRDQITLSLGHLRPSENTDIYLMIHNSSRL